MDEAPDDQEGSRKAVLVLLTLLITAVFVGIIRSFLIALFLAAVFSSLVLPLHTFLTARLGGRSAAGAGLTLLLITVVVVVPLLAILGVVVAQGAHVVEEALPWLKEHLQAGEGDVFVLPEWFPFRDRIDLSTNHVVSKAGELAGKAGTYLLKLLSAATQGTAAFFVNLFVMLYAMFHFLRDGPAVRETVLRYLPFPEDVEARLEAKGVSVVRATIKGTFIIGIVQGALGGLAFTVAGITSAAFWATLMAISSVVPVIGTALVWGPAVLYLYLTGDTFAATGVLLWSIFAVGSVDNLLRPRLVGNDTQMPDLLILISTLGGLSVFGAAGIMIGPLFAAMFMTMWDFLDQELQGTAPEGSPPGESGEAGG